jgi:hypothetical protein
MNIGSHKDIAAHVVILRPDLNLIFGIRRSVMRVAFFSVLLVLAACNQEPTTASNTGSTPESAAAPAPPVGASKVEGWETSNETYVRLGTIVPDFTAKLVDGKELSNGTLRGRWTIMGFQSPDDAPEEAPEEARFVGALSSAVDQDPDLDFLFVYSVPHGALVEIPPQWPSVRDDDRELQTKLGIEKTPAYLLVGPDLVIEAYRGALSATPEDGIKPVIRGVAEIKKQIAAPQ